MKVMKGKQKARRKQNICKSLVLFVFGAVIFLLIACMDRTQRQPLSNVTAIPPSIVSQESLQGGPVKTERPFETHRFVDPRLPLLTWKTWSAKEISGCRGVQAAVVNHHILAGDLMGRLFSFLAACRPEIQHVIILSPDHFARGRTMISTHTNSYLAGGAVTAPYLLLVTQTTSTLSFIEEDPDVFEKEHGIGALIPFVQRAWPTADLATFAIRSDLGRVEAATFVESLMRTISSSTIVIVSSDMSHYLPAEQALMNDEKTRQAFRMGDRGFFWAANDDFTDYGKGIWTALALVQGSLWHELDHRISSEYDGGRQNTTSYITGWWGR